MGKVGFIWGILVSLMCCYISTYGMITVQVLSKQLEIKNMETNMLGNDYVQSLHDLAYHCSKKMGLIMGVIAF